jgi:transcriptional regulator with XRE-family HTH domain
MKTLNNFAARLRQLRADAKLTQEELAERSGAHRQTIARLELGTRQPTWETVQLLAAALGVSCEAFQTEVRPAGTPARKGKKRKGE